MYVKDCVQKHTFVEGRKAVNEQLVSLCLSLTVVVVVSYVSLKLPQYQIGSFDVCEYFTSEYYKLLAYILFSD